VVAYGEDFVILACTVLIQITGVTDGRTDERTPRRWLRRAKLYMLSRVKTEHTGETGFVSDWTEIKVQIIAIF